MTCTLHSSEDVLKPLYTNLTIKVATLKGMLYGTLVVFESQFQYQKTQKLLHSLQDAQVNFSASFMSSWRVRSLTNYGTFYAYIIYWPAFCTSSGDWDTTLIMLLSRSCESFNFLEESCPYSCKFTFKMLKLLLIITLFSVIWDKNLKFPCRKVVVSLPRVL